MYDHFAKDCLNSDTEREQSEQIKQMFNLEKDKKALNVWQTLMMILLGQIQMRL